MTATVGGNTPTTQNKTDLAQAFDLVRVNSQSQLIGPSGQVVGGGVTLSRDRLLAGNFSADLRSAIADAVAYADANNGMDYTITIPGGEFQHDGEFINMPPWIKINLPAKVRLNCQNGSRQGFWIRADLPGYTQPAIDEDGVTEGDYSSGAANVSEIFNGPGQIQMRDTGWAVGGCALRVGSGDGVWGTLYTGGRQIYTTKIVIGKMHIRGFETGLQLTNYQVFSVDFNRLNINGARYSVVTSTSTQGFDFGEQHFFHKPFISNTAVDAVTFNSAHQILFVGGSVTFTEDTIFRINANGAKAQVQGMRLERFDKISVSSGSFDRSIICLDGATWITPTKKDGTTTLDHHVREFFSGTHQVSVASAVMDMGTAGTAYNLTYASAALKYLCDASVNISLGSLRITQSTAAVIKATPCWTRRSIIPNSDFASGISGWSKSTAGTLAYVAGDGSIANGCLSITVSAAQAFVYSPRARVSAGRLYGGCPSVKVVSASSPTASFLVNTRLVWLGESVGVAATGDNPFSTTSGSATVTLSLTNVGLVCQPGDLVFIASTNAVGGIAAADLIGWRRVENVSSPNAVTLTAGAAASSTASGGGTGGAVAVSLPASYIGATTYRAQAITSGLWDVWLQHGTRVEEAPAATTWVKAEIATGGSHTGELRIDDVWVGQYA
jgi:hypothetical protein